MANLSITRRCRRGCRYCFAQQEMGRDGEVDMSPEVYEAAIGFLERSGFPEARFLGGEPTEHPRFCEYVEKARQRGFRVMVFSGGMVPESVLEYMAGLPNEGFLMALNTVDPSNDEEALVKRQREICQRLGSKVMLGVNIRSSSQKPTYVFDWVTQYELRRTIRVGIAHPIWGGNNEYYRLRGPRVISVLEDLTEIGGGMGVEVGFDCGFTPCMFSSEFVESHGDMFFGAGKGSEEATGTKRSFNGNSSESKGHSSKSEARKEAQELDRNDSDESERCKEESKLDRDDSEGCKNRFGEKLENRMEAIGMRCSPIVDILPEGECIACYALSRFVRYSLPSRGRREDLASEFEGALSSALPVGVHRECVYCSYREKGMCNGGCRARRAQRLRPNGLIALERGSIKESIHR